MGAQTHILSFRPVDAKYSKPLDRLILVSASPNVLHIFNAATNNDQTVALSTAPTNVALSPDGLHAAVASTSAVSYVNLQTASVEQVFIANVGTGIVTLSATYIYVMPSYVGYPISIQISNGNQTTAPDLEYSSGGTYDPLTSEVYAAQNGASPNSLQHFAATGILGTEQRGPYFQEFEMCGPLWLSPDGSKIYSACGTIFQASTDPSRDMHYASSLLGLQQVSALADSGSQVAAVPGPSSANFESASADDQVNLFDSAHYNPTGTLLIPPFTVDAVPYTGHGRYVFFNAASTSIYVISQADSSAGLTQDFAIDTFPLAGGSCSPQFATDSASVSAATYRRGQVPKRTIDNGCHHASRRGVLLFRRSKLVLFYTERRNRYADHYNSVQ